MEFLNTEKRVDTSDISYIIKGFNNGTIKDGDNHVVLCHYPIAHWRNADYGYIHLYGHIHAGRDSRPFEDYKAEMRKRDIPYRCYNVGCMMPYMNYTPRTLDEITGGCK